ncbi:MAG: hypothetical protein DA328_09040, partial [Nitrososphaeraceae archaeon]|nr:hypothetical protein [Nitrososphaeraceae archaeon]
FTLSATTSTRTESDSITVTVVEPSTSTDVLKFIKDGQEVQFKLTGKKVAMEKGSNHRNGQRYNVNHFYENYIMLGKFKTGKGQEQIEMKTDGPNHGGCTQLNNCMWYEPAIYMNGKVKFGTEYPHPTNHDVDLNVIQYHKDLGYSIDQTTIQYAVGAFYDKDGKRNIIQAATKDLNGIPEINIWAIENGQIFPSKYLPRDLKKIMQENDEGGLEAEIRMHQATNSDTSMTDCYVYEIEPLT